jgi:hypothetical protein
MTKSPPILNLFNSFKINYWLDQGSLLKFHRDRIFDPSDDIDISIFYSQKDIIEKNIKRIESLGYRVRKCFYNGYIFQYKLLPNNNELRTVDIKVYYDNGKNIFSVKKVTKHSTNKLKRVLIYKIVQIFYWKSLEVKIDSLFYSFIFDVYTWIIPKNLISNIGDKYNYGFQYPDQIEEYLEYHFGNWQTAIRLGVWKSYLHDKALIKGKPKADWYKFEK